MCCVKLSYFTCLLAYLLSGLGLGLDLENAGLEPIPA